VLATLAYCLSYRRFDLWRHSMTRPWVWALFFAIALPWPIAAYLDQGNALLYAWVMEQTVHRAAKPLEGHGGGLFYYIPVVIIGTLPFTVPVLGVLRNARALAAAPMDRFLLCWFAVVFIMFSLLGTKLPHYMLYGYTPLFLLAARRIHERQPGASLGIPVAALCLLLAILPFLVPVVQGRVDDPFALAVMADLGGAFTPAYFGALGVAFALALAACLGKVPARARVICACCALATAFNFAAMPAAAHLLQAPVRDAALLAKQNNWTVVLYAFKMPSFLFYRAATSEERMPADGEIVVCRSPDLAELEEKGVVTGKEILYEKRGIVMARVRSAIPSTTP
jgi:4-amino-4-deoxy-L-arabinose transferase-like glycosyltransferase